MKKPAPNTGFPYSLALMLLLSLLAAGCASVNLDSYTPTSAEEAIDMASNEDEPETAQSFLLRTANRLQQQDKYEAARQVLKSDPFTPFATADIETRHQLLSMTSAVALEDAEWASRLADSLSPESFLDYDRDQLQTAGTLMASTYELAGDPLAAALTLMSLVQNDPDADSQALHNRIWQTLKRTPDRQLQDRQERAIGYEAQGWLELATALREPGVSLDNQGRIIRSWQNNWPGHPAAAILPAELALVASLAEQQPERIALALPLSGPLASAGRAIRDGFLAAFYEDDSVDKEATDVMVTDTANRSFREVYQELSQEDRELIIGPLEKEKLSELTNMNTLPVPLLGLNYLPDDQTAPEGLYQFGLAPEDEARQIAERLSTDNIRQVLVLIPEGDWGTRIEQALIEEMKDNSALALDVQRYFPEENLRSVTADLLGITVSRERAIDVERTAGIDVEFEPRRRQDAQAIIMVAQPTVARQFKPLFAFYFGGDLPVYSPSSVYEGTPDPSRDRDLNGVLFTDIPWILAPDLELRDRIHSVYPDTPGQVRRLFAMGADAWQLTKRLPFLSQVEDAKVDAYTGTLTMNEQGSIAREQLWARFIQGTPKRVPANKAEEQPEEQTDRVLEAL